MPLPVTENRSRKHQKYASLILVAASLRVSVNGLMWRNRSRWSQNSIILFNMHRNIQFAQCVQAFFDVESQKTKTSTSECFNELHKSAKKRTKRNETFASTTPTSVIFVAIVFALVENRTTTKKKCRIVYFQRCSLRFRCSQKWH